MEQLDLSVLPDFLSDYRVALEAACNYVLERFDVAGIIVAGSIVNGHGDLRSDLDIQIIHNKNSRQRIQKRFEGIPCECFINPPFAIRKYFMAEHQRRRPSTAHMLSTGIVVMNNHSVVPQLIEEAVQWMEKIPEWDAKLLEQKKYHAAILVEDANDSLPRGLAISNRMIHLAFEAIIDFVFYTRRQFLPRTKDLINALKKDDLEVYQLTIKLLTEESIPVKLSILNQLAFATLKVDGFFEWSSDLEELTNSK